MSSNADSIADGTSAVEPSPTSEAAWARSGRERALARGSAKTSLLNGGCILSGEGSEAFPVGEVSSGDAEASAGCPEDSGKEAVEVSEGSEGETLITSGHQSGNRIMNHPILNTARRCCQLMVVGRRS